MGVALWILSGLAAWFVARIVPSLRPAPWAGELVVALLAALAAGVAATAFDFGGWRALEARAAAFAFFLALSAVGVSRLVRAYGSARHHV